MNVIILENQLKTMQELYKRTIDHIIRALVLEQIELIERQLKNIKKD